MIEVNLIPDVKQELLRAKRIRTYVTSGAIIISIAAAGVIILMATYFFAGQGIRGKLVDDSIQAQFKQLSSIQDLSNVLTVQAQLGGLSDMHSSKNIDSRLFDILTTINPAPPNQIAISTVRINSDTKTITIEGQAANGYEAAESFKKTILGTTMTYTDTVAQSSSKTVPLATSVSTSETSYGEDANGKKVLRFTMSFVYDPIFFGRSASNVTIARPDKQQNVTDSFVHVPQSLFVERAGDIGGNR